MRYTDVPLPLSISTTWITISQRKYRSRIDFICKHDSSVIDKRLTVTLTNVANGFFAQSYSNNIRLSLAFLF